MLTANQLKGLRALVVDDLREMRSMLRNTLVDAQIKDVVLAPDARAAVEAIRAAPFNLILSDYDLGAGTDGQQLLEYLRRERLMPPGGLFFVISGDSTIDRVASAAEMLPDGYLVKPVATAQLLARIEEALARHVELRPMYEAVHAGRWAEGLLQCERFEKAGSRFRVELLRHMSMCQVALGRWDDALVTYRRALQVRGSMTWARLGVARCALAMGDIEAARSTVQQILVERPYHAGAYDLMLELLERSGDVSSALAVASRAAEHIPSPGRSRRLAEAAYLADDLETADAALSKVLRQTAQALTRDAGDGALLAQVALARGEPQRAMKLIARELDEHPKDPRTRALAAAIDVQACTALGWTAQAQDAAAALAAAFDVPADPRTRLLIAKAALTAGMEEEGLRVLEEAVAAAEKRSSAESASARVLAAKVLHDAGFAERAAVLSVDRSAEAAREAEAAVRRLRAGAFDEALALIASALPKAREHTDVLIAAVEVYLMTMRVRGLKPELLKQVQSALGRLHARGTADPRRLQLMETYLAKLEAGASEAVEAGR
ncbi:MAG: hypothetical protein RJA99_355 [Pseudomonadota bacterium]|jgi:DNA-binding response OmpR family regulator